jgi:hypothetical protein
VHRLFFHANILKTANRYPYITPVDPSDVVHTPWPTSDHAVSVCREALDQNLTDVAPILRYLFPILVELPPIATIFNFNDLLCTIDDAMSNDFYNLGEEIKV